MADEQDYLDAPVEATAGDPPRWQRLVFASGPRMIAGWLILIGLGINFANVISRYLFDFALFWAEEILIFLVVWCVFLGAIAVSFNGAHLKMDLVSARLPSPWKEILNAIAAIAFLVCGGFVVVQSWKVVALVVEDDSVSVTASVPMVIPHTALLAGVALMVLAVLFRLGAHMRNRF